MAKKLYCSKCQSNLGHAIVQHKASPEDFRRVVVEGRRSDGVYDCRCKRCGHTWKSKSAEAASIWSSANA